MSILPSTRQARLVSYGGEQVSCELAEPASTDELVAVLQQASRANRRITFRGQGQAFDSQSLNADLVISLERFSGLWFGPDAATVEAAAGERWGELVRAARRRGRFPAVVVSTSKASVAGTTSGNCISRFTPVNGQDGDHVIAIELVTVAGERLRCTRDDNREVFFGVTGGLGYLGAITSVSIALQPNAHDQVETRVIEAGPVRDVIAACTPAAIATSQPTTRYAVLLPTLDRGMAYSSQYVTGQRLQRYRLVHEPRSVLRLWGELVKRPALGNRLVWWLGFHTLASRYVDPILDFTFFMDANARMRQLGRRMGCAMRVVQQSFVVPVDATTEFIERARRTFRRVRLWPSLSDVLYSPSDEGLLSATHALDGFFVSFAFEVSGRGDLERIARAFVSLSRECRVLGGRVHLTKNVHAEPDDLAAMYEATLPRFAALKRRLDPEGRIRNAFLERNFPSLV